LIVAWSFANPHRTSAASDRGNPFFVTSFANFHGNLKKAGTGKKGEKNSLSERTNMPTKLAIFTGAFLRPSGILAIEFALE
jgi:hypothetical protein